MASGQDHLYATVPLGHFVELLAARSPAPGGGSAAAVAASIAAGLVAMAARFAPAGQDPRDERAAHAVELAADALRLADADATAYAAVIAAQRGAGLGDEGARTLVAALSAAGEVPLAIAELAAELTALGASLARDGNTRLRGDALVAVHLASAAASAAAGLVEIDLESTPHDGRLERARRARQRAHESLALANEPQ